MSRLGLVGVAAVRLAACRPDCTPHSEDAPLVLLVSVDTPRAYHLGSWGSTAQVTVQRLVIG